MRNRVIHSTTLRIGNRDLPRTPLVRVWVLSSCRCLRRRDVFVTEFQFWSASFFFPIPSFFPSFVIVLVFGSDSEESPYSSDAETEEYFYSLLFLLLSLYIYHAPTAMHTQPTSSRARVLTNARICVWSLTGIGSVVYFVGDLMHRGGGRVWDLHAMFRDAILVIKGRWGGYYRCLLKYYLDMYISSESKQLIIMGYPVKFDRSWFWMFLMVMRFPTQ